MSAIRAIWQGSFGAAIYTCSKKRSFQACTSYISISRFSVCGLPSGLDIYASGKNKTAGWPLQYTGERNLRTLPLSALAVIQQLRTNYSASYSTRSSGSKQSLKNILNHQSELFNFRVNDKFGYRAYSSHPGGRQHGPQNVLPDGATEASGRTTDAVGSDWVDVLNHAQQSAVDAAAIVGQKAKEVSDKLDPYIQNLYDSNPYLEKLIIPVGGTLSATLVAWFIMPRILRKIHMYATKSPLSLIARSSTKEIVPYEKSLWSALEDPARYLITFMAFSQLGVMIAPTTSQYLPQAWRGAVVLSFVWFVHRWKTNFFARAMAYEVPLGIERDKLLTLEKVSSVGLLILGVMALAEACGVAVQSILTVGGIGGVATAFAARDILGNLLSGLSLQFSKPFSVGDNIKAGSIEGQVVEMGLTTTTLINPEKFPVIVPNSLFSSQVIVNKSRAQWRASVTKIPVRLDDLEKIPFVSEEIKSMLRSNPSVFLEKDAPFCYLSRIEISFAELTLGCNLKTMRRDELYATEQDILLKAAKIIKQHGAELGSTLHDLPNR